MGRPRTRGGALLDPQIETVLEANEQESPGPGQSFKIKEVRRGTHSVSESSATLPKSSPILAEGQFISPTRTEQVQREHDEPVSSLGNDMQEEGEGEKAEQAIVHERVHQPESSDKQGHQPNKEHPGHAEKTAVEATLFVIHEKDHAVPAIEVRRPSEAAPTTPGVTLPNGPDPLQQASISDSISPMALPADPPALAATTSDPEAPPTAISDVADPDLLTFGTGQHNHPSRLERVGKTKKRKVIGTARRVILRKKVLSMILGRDLAGTVHPLLQTPGGG